MVARPSKLLLHGTVISCQAIENQGWSFEIQDQN